MSSIRVLAWENMPMTKALAIVVFCLLLLGKARAQDEFSGIRCGAEIPKALIGKKFRNERVVVTEARHKDLGLKDHGGQIVSDRLFLASWLICGTDYELLINTKSDVIRDAIAIPIHSKRFPLASGHCRLNGRQLADSIDAILDNSGGLKPTEHLKLDTYLKATAAWKIDEGNERFATLSIVGLTCDLAGAITVDGGP